ncbi:MAG: class I SAM-dependent methyltransferase [Verrucomicrobiota bacterium]
MKLSSPFDQKYFDQWYRQRSKRVSTLDSAQRKATLAIAVAEYYLERPVKNVLDIGCGEGQWQPILRKLRPGIQYQGIDPSAYAIKRFGKKRNLTLGSFSDLPKQKLAKMYDLIICSDILYYVLEPELKRGLQKIANHLRGIAFLEAYSSDEKLEGDVQGMLPRSVGDYKRVFKQTGFISCGSHCYVNQSLAYRVTAMERGIV